MIRGTIRLGMVAAMLAGFAAGGQAQEDTFEWQGAIESGQVLEVRGISGDIVATLASGSTAEVVATKEGRSRDFDEVEILMFQDRDGIVICAVYGDHGRDSCDSHDRNDDHRGRGKNIDVSVDFEVRVPAGVEFMGHTVSGDVEAEGLESNVDGATVSGDVVISTTGVARATTVSGDLDIEMGSLDWDRLRFTTVSGDISIKLPADLDSEVDFESLSGDFRTNFDVVVTRSRDRFVGSEFEGRIGDGASQLSFKTVSGDVILRRTGGRSAR
jgi:putative adhesin